MEFKQALEIVLGMARERKWGRSLSQEEKDAINLVAKFLDIDAKDPYDTPSGELPTRL